MKKSAVCARSGAALLALALWAIAAGGAGAQTATPERERAAAGASAEYIDVRLEELRRLTAELEAQEADVRAGIEGAEERRDHLTHQLEELAALLEKAQARLDVADRRLTEVTGELGAKAAELERAEQAFEATVAKLRARAVSVYKHGPISMIELVLGADDFGDLLNKLAFALQLAHVDNQRLEQLEREKAAIVGSLEVIEELRTRQASEAAAVRGERNRVAAVRTTVDSQRATVVGELRAHHEELGDIEEQRRRYAAETEQLRAESAAIAAFLAGRTDSAPTVSKKGMSWPVSGPVTSGYGWRMHPILGERRFHAGIDIAAPTGTPIGAAAPGQVIFVGSKSGYGNTVIVYHGGGISTLYAHMSSFGASNEAQVLRRQTIGRVGCTGYCTGPHLHFEVRVNGEPVDPMEWLP